MVENKEEQEKKLKHDLGDVCRDPGGRGVWQCDGEKWTLLRNFKDTQEKNVKGGAEDQMVCYCRLVVGKSVLACS